MHVGTDIEQAEWIWCGLADGFGSRLPADSVVGERFRRRVAPGEELFFHTAAGRVLPFCFRRKSEVASSYGTQPGAVVGRCEPGDTDDRLLRMREVGVTKERRRKLGLMVQENVVFGIRNLMGRELKGIDPDAVDGALIVLAGGGAHEENASGDGNHLSIKVWERGLGECEHLPNREASINSLANAWGGENLKNAEGADEDTTAPGEAFNRKDR